MSFPPSRRLGSMAFMDLSDIKKLEQDFAQDLEQLFGDFVGKGWLATFLVALILIALTALVSYWATKFLRRILDYGEERGEGLPSSSIFINITRIAIWFIGLSVVLSTCFDVDVSAAITALGIGGIAISLGFQDTLSNLIGGLQLSLMRIIAPGDHIEVSGQLGVVKDVTWRHTTIVNSSGEEISIPNSIINKNALVHHLPVETVTVNFVAVPSALSLDKTASLIEKKSHEAAGLVGMMDAEPRVSFSEILGEGYKGKVTLRMRDSADADAAKSAVIRAIAPLTRGDAAREASLTLEEPSLSAGEDSSHRAAAQSDQDSFVDSAKETDSSPEPKKKFPWF